MENVFVVRPFATTSVGWWYSERDQIDLSPPYQRKSGVWNLRDKAYLIDSIINGFDVPKFYVADFSYSSSRLNASNRPYAVIDGRQRFEALFDFLDGKVPLNSDFIYLADPSLALGGLTARDLALEFPRILKRVESFNISVMSVITDQESRINDLFVRLNKSKSLTGAEVRSAMLGEVPKHIQHLSSHPFFTEFVAFSNRRKQHENVAAKLMLIEHRKDFVETKKTSLDRFVAEALLTETEFTTTAQSVWRGLDALTDSFDPGDAALRSSGNVPVYYWLVRNFGPMNMGALLHDFSVFRGRHPTHPAIVIFNSVSRSANDEYSYRVRYAVLQAFLKNGHALPPNEDLETWMRQHLSLSGSD